MAVIDCDRTQPIVDWSTGSSASRLRIIANPTESRIISTIDAEAAETQERVESLEKQYMERLEREREAALPGDESPTTTGSTTLPHPPQQ